MSRFINPIPRGEMERRWTLIRNRLRDRQLDALVVVGETDNLDGAVRWMVDSVIGYRKVVVFDAKELMTLYEHGGAGRVKDLDGNEPGYPGVGQVVSMPTFPSVEYTATYEAKAVCELAKKRGYRRIGLYHPLSAPYGFINTLKQTLSNVEFVDETEFVDRCKAIKSPAEIEIIERAAAIQDTVFQRTVDYIQPGKRDADLTAYAVFQAKLLGGDFGISLTGSASPGELAFYRTNEQQGRVIQQGDYMNLLVETGSPGGYIVEVGRVVSVGPPPSELVDVFEHCKAAQEYTLSLMKLGTKASDVYEGYTDFIRKLGYPAEKRIYSHGQGYDIVERPLIREDETMTLEVGMCLAVHPSLATKSAFAVICDDVVIEANGPRIVHKTPRQLVRI